MNVGIGSSAQRATGVPIQKTDAPEHTTGAALSDSARALAAAREAVQRAMDVREERVADIRKRVSGGTYMVPAQVLARKMLELGIQAPRDISVLRRELLTQLQASSESAPAPAPAIPLPAGLD